MTEGQPATPAPAAVAIDAAGVQAVSDWVLDQGLASDDMPGLIDGLCTRLVGIGLPLWRVHVSMSTLDPSFGVWGSTWRRGGRASLEQIEHGNESLPRWQQSPLKWMIDRDLTTLRRRLEASEIEFPVLAEFRAEGATDWHAHLTRYGGPTPKSGLLGTITTWTSDRPGGFDDRHIAIIDRLVPRLALACYRMTLLQVAETLLDAYLGADAGRRVLAGQVRRGQAERFAAAILFADLRGFTALADRTPPERLLDLLNEHLGAITDAVESRGGQVLKFMGDGLLAVFSLDDRDAPAACAAALAAAEAALAANAAVNARQGAAATLPLDVALHLGEVLYGNVGAARRLDFTVVGPAVNEASRIEALCQPLDQSLLLSARFAGACPRPTLSLGRHPLRGVAEPQELFRLA